MKLDQPWKYLAQIPNDIMDQLGVIVNSFDWTQHPSPEPGHTGTAQIDCALGSNNTRSLGTVSRELTDLMEPIFDWGQQFYPDHIPFKAYVGALRPNSCIYLHIDPGRHHSLSHRQHLVYNSPEGCEHLSWSDNWQLSRTQMIQGTSWEIDNIRYHAGHNRNANTWRWHAVIDWIPKAIYEDKGVEWLKGRDVDMLMRVYNCQLKARTTPGLEEYVDEQAWEKVKFLGAFIK